MIRLNRREREIVKSYCPGYSAQSSIGACLRVFVGAQRAAGASWRAIAFEWERLGLKRSHMWWKRRFGSLDKVQRPGDVGDSPSRDGQESGLGSP